MFREIYKVLSQKEKLYLIFVFFGAFLASSMDVVGIGSIVVYITFLSNPDEIISKIPFNNITEYLNSLSENELVVFFSIFLVSIFLLKNIFLFFYFYAEALINKKMVVRASAKILSYYLLQNYSFYLNTNSSKMVNSVLIETGRFVHYIFSFLLLYREIIVLLLMVVFLFNFSSQYSFLVILVMIIFSALFFLKFKNIIKKVGVEATKYSELNYKTLYEIFNTIKSIKLSSRYDYWTKKFKNYKNKFHSNQVKNYMFGRIPRIFLEIVSVFSLVTIILILVLKGKTIYEVITLLTLVSLIIIRSLPAFVNINTGIAALNFNSETFKKTLSNLKQFKEYEKFNNKKKDRATIENVEKINLIDVNFSYLKDKQILKNISLELKKGEMVGVVGKTGSGKTTLVDLLTGLIKPDSGKVLINNQGYENIFFGSIGYITQDTMLIDDSITNNICLGIENKNINKDKLFFALESSCLSEFISNLPEKEGTFVGDRGIRISGGQKQRIGIARAIYNDFEILVLDEATSSLDYSTEKKIMTKINQMKKDKIIIMITHRLSTLDFCDKVILLEEGAIKDIGKIDYIKNKYEYILNKN